MRSRLLFCLAWLHFLAHSGEAAEPRVTDPGYTLELVAKEPQIVTPVGMTFDRKGRMLVIESHTHMPPKEYAGPGSDRVRMLSDSDGDGKLDRWSTFAKGFRHSMNLLARGDGAVYLVTRHNVELLRDTDDDGVADKQDVILTLETKDDYPHSGLSGIALEPGGKSLLISLGENHGVFYRLIGADRNELTGKDGAGTVFRCKPDGGVLERVAVGFWNPFSVCVVPDGRIFAVDNDPDASPPCRLVHVVAGGDYGYRYQYGRAGTHPLQAWNGQLPGTLPMVCGVGEGPTAILPHAGGLWVTSWGDHRIERYELVPRGASYGASRAVIVQGGADFRPTGMAIAPDGSLYFADWVLRDYPVHGRGRIWRLVLPKGAAGTPFSLPSGDDVTAHKVLPDRLKGDPFVAANAAWKFAKKANIETDSFGQATNDHVLPLAARLTNLQTLRLHGIKQPEPLLRAALQDKLTEIRLFAVRWIADERIMALRDDVAKLLEGPQPNRRYYLAVLGAVDWLDREPELRGTEIADELLVRELSNSNRTADAHALALSLVKPDNKFLTNDRLREYLQSKHESLRLEAVRTLGQQTNPKRFQLLSTVAEDELQSDELRAEAIVGLLGAAEQNRQLLAGLSVSGRDVVQREARRASRLAGLTSEREEAKPPAGDLAAWKVLLSGQGDAAAGRRLFFSPVGGRCSVCHKYDGRGGNVGPDLTEIGRSNLREKIITSILQPSQEIARDYQAWVLVTSDGKTYNGLRLPKAGDNGKEDYADAAGKTFTLASALIEDRHVAGTSIMPDNLQSVLSIGDLRDLVTFLSATSD